MPRKTEGIISEKALSEKMIIDEIIVIKLNLKAGIIEWLSQSIETKPSGIVTFAMLKIFLFKKAVIGESKL